MADTTMTPAATPQDKQAASQAALADLGQRIYFDVLASRGYAAQTDKQAAAMLETGQAIALLQEKAAAEKLAQGEDFFSRANVALGQALGKQAQAPAGRVDAQELKALIGKLASNGWLDVVADAEGKEPAGG